MCEQLKRKVDIWCLLKAKWRGRERLLVGVEDRTYTKLWWSGNNAGIEGIGILV